MKQQIDWQKQQAPLWVQGNALVGGPGGQSPPAENSSELF